MRFLPFLAALGTAFALLPAVMWLTLVCADFLGLASSTSPRPGWLVFACLTGAALVLPPFLYAWPDEGRSLPELLREAARATLLSFAVFALCLLVGLRPFLHWLGLPDIMAAPAMGRLAPALACPFIVISARIARALLPRSGPGSPAPRSIRRFSTLSLAFACVLGGHAFLFGGQPVGFSSMLSPLCAAWLFLWLRNDILVRGNAGYVPVWQGGSLVCVLHMALASQTYAPAPLLVLAAAGLLALGGTVCLLREDSAEWVC